MPTKESLGGDPENKDDDPQRTNTTDGNTEIRGRQSELTVFAEDNDADGNDPETAGGGENRKSVVTRAVGAINDAVSTALGGSPSPEDPVDAFAPATPIPSRRDQGDNNAKQTDDDGVEQAQEMLKRHIISNIREKVVARRLAGNCVELYHAERPFVTMDVGGQREYGLGLNLNTHTTSTNQARAIAHESGHALVGVYGYSLSEMGQQGQYSPQEIGLHPNRFSNNEGYINFDWESGEYGTAEIYMMAPSPISHPTGVGEWWGDVQREVGVPAAEVLTVGPDVTPDTLGQQAPDDGDHPLSNAAGFEVPDGDEEEVAQTKVTNFASAVNKAWMRQILTQHRRDTRGDVGKAELVERVIKTPYSTVHAHETAAMTAETIRGNTDKRDTENTIFAAEIAKHHPELVAAALELYNPPEMVERGFRAPTNSDRWNIEEYYF